MGNTILVKTSKIASTRPDEKKSGGGHSLISYLPWDSNFFGYRIAAINSNELNNELWGKIESICNAEGIDLLYFECEVTDRESILTAESADFNLVDTRLLFSKRILRGSGISPIVRKARDSDASALSEMSATMYTNSRFYFDKHIPDDKCDELYRQWIINSLHGYEDIVLLAEVNNSVAGFVSGKYNAPVGDIGLIGVDARFVGQGIGSNLLKSVEYNFKLNGITTSRVLTQARNIPAQRLYGKNNYKIERITNYYHKWFRGF